MVLVGIVGIITNYLFVGVNIEYIKIVELYSYNVFLTTYSKR